MKQKLLYIRSADGVVTGPYTEAKVRQRRQSGRLGPGDGISSDKVHWDIIPRPAESAQPDDGPVEPALFLRCPGAPVFGAATSPCEQSTVSGVEPEATASSNATPAAKRVDWEKWITLAWSVWRAPWDCDKLLSYLRPLQWIALIYSLLVLFLSWGFSVPSVLILGYGWLTVLVFGLLSWLLVWFNSVFFIRCSCWFGGKDYTAGADSSVVKWTELLRSSTFAGTAFMLHRLPVRNMPGLSIFTGILLSLFIWEIICQCKTLFWYRQLRGETRRKLAWFLFVFNLYQLSWGFFTLYYFGGYR